MPITYRIHPAIGVARVGDSPDDYFVGPEAPGIPPTLTKPDAPALPGGQKGAYKDAKSSIKRQGARFRVYEYTSNDAGTRDKGARNHRRRRPDRMGGSPGQPQSRRQTNP